MTVTNTRVFKNGNSAAVRLPAALGIVPGTRVTIEQTNGGVTIKPVHDKTAAKQELLLLIADLQAIWAEHGGPPERPAEREPFEMPERPGL